MPDSIFDNFSNDEQGMASIRRMLPLAEEEILEIASLGAGVGPVLATQVSGAVWQCRSGHCPRKDRRCYALIFSANCNALSGWFKSPCIKSSWLRRFRFARISFCLFHLVNKGTRHQSAKILGECLSVVADRAVRCSALQLHGPVDSFLNLSEFLWNRITTTAIDANQDAGDDAQLLTNHFGRDGCWLCIGILLSGWHAQQNEQVVKWAWMCNVEKWGPTLMSCLAR